MYADATLDDVRVYNVRDHGSQRIGEGFRVAEFACRDGSDVVLIHPSLVRLLEMIRDATEAPLHILSAYRTPSHNRAIGGVAQSAHLYGFAADVVSREVSPEMVAQLADGLNAGGVGRYDTFTHVDVRGHNRRWHG